MKKRLLFINGHLRSGGVERALVAILKNMDYSRFDVTLLLIEDGRDYLCDIPKEVNIIERSLDGCFKSIKSLCAECFRDKEARFAFLFRLAWHISGRVGNNVYRSFKRELGLSGRYDGVVAFRPGLSTVFGSIVESEKKVAWWHHGCLHDDGYDRSQIIDAWRNYHNVVTVSDGVGRLLRDASTQLGEKLKVIHNIVDTDDMIAKGNESHTEYSSDVFNIVSVSRLVIEKKFEVIPVVAAILKSKGVKFKWHIIGEGPRRPLIEDAVAVNDVADTVILHGNKTNPYPWIKNADLMVHVSPVESFGLVLTEAMALGTPCIAVESAGSREIINQTNGIRVNFSAEEIAEAILGVISAPERLKEMRKAAYESVKAYSPEVIMPKLYALFE